MTTRLKALVVAVIYSCLVWWAVVQLADWIMVPGAGSDGAPASPSTERNDSAPGQ
ncbi:hypothetical protein J5J10_09100 [Ciceribacter sp. L1K23]|uniref:hypothetical protein n=1 Tax=Ciceribacter sp. L1K23 TaxID=2820276 RepID=UPI001B840C47|nr:hypothetical protein [Ciceribacter sp. L1K23]MBR0555835.1 hypothetical protein [Ciceribacter sp. L1K23]